MKPFQSKTHPRTKGRSDPGWSEEAAQVMAAVLSRHGLTVHDLSQALTKMGLDIGYKALAGKIARGTFSFAFFLEAMDALGIRAVYLSNKVDESPAQKSVRAR